VYPDPSDTKSDQQRIYAGVVVAHDRHFGTPSHTHTRTPVHHPC